MAAERVFKSVSGSTLNFIRPSELAEKGVTGQILEAVFVKSTQNQKDRAKLDYIFRDDAGQEHLINGAGNLGVKMKKVTPGTLVRVIYNGKQEMKTGPYAGTPAHNFDVEAETEA